MVPPKLSTSAVFYYYVDRNQLASFVLKQSLLFHSSQELKRNLIYGQIKKNEKEKIVHTRSSTVSS